MDNPAELRWSAAPGLVVLAAVAAVGALAWCVLLVVTGADRAGLLISGVATVGLAVAALHGGLVRPRLAADAAGVTTRTLRGAVHHPWADVLDVRVLRTRRFGRESSLLELDVRVDGRERLLVFGRLDLAADPEDVADALAAARP